MRIGSRKKGIADFRIVLKVYIPLDFISGDSDSFVISNIKGGLQADIKYVCNP